MPHRPVLPHTDPRLRQPANPVTAFDAALKALADDIVDTLRHNQALALTAVHIGVPQQVAVIQLGDATTTRIYVNPRIEWASDDLARSEEGSVSMSGVTEFIERPARVRIAYQDLDGNPQTEEADGLLAVCHQHEIDQLAGIFWTDKLSRLKRDRVLARYRKRA
jgi:peptide deformylase